MTGHVRQLRESYGFITPDVGPDLFFHTDDLTDEFDLLVGDRVTFDVVDPQPAQGPRAARVAMEGRA